MPAPHILTHLLQLKIKHHEKLLASLVTELDSTAGEYRCPVEAKIKHAETTLKLLRMKEAIFDESDGGDSDDEVTEIIS